MNTKFRLLFKSIAELLKKLPVKCLLWVKNILNESWVATFVQVVLAFLVGFYALETRYLRKHGEIQLRYAVEPSISVDINKFNKPSLAKIDSVVKSEYGWDEGQNMMPQYSQEDTLTLGRLKYIIGARNTSPNNADRIKIFIFDPEFEGNNKYLIFTAPQQAVTGKHFKIYEGVNFGFIAVSDSNKDRKSIEIMLISEYGEGSKFIFPLLGKDLNRTCLFVVYRDNRKQTYCLKKWVTFDGWGSVISSSEKLFTE